MSSNFRGRHFPRRIFLGGAGTAVALPFLESALPRTARAQTATPPKRLVVFFFPNGFYMPAWKPTGTGTNFQFADTLQSLTPYKSKTTVLSGLNNEAGAYKPGAYDGGAGDHMRGCGSFLTCTHLVTLDQDPVVNNVSIDQIIAKQIGKDSPFPSIQLGSPTYPGHQADCEQFDCASRDCISWAGPNMPLGKQVDVRAAFDRLFAGFDPTQTDQERTKRARLKKSVLDMVLGQANELNGKLSKTDKIKLDQYLSGVRELENSIGKVISASCTPGTRPAADLYNNYPNHVRAMGDLMVLAIQCDLTRVITYMFRDSASFDNYDFLNIAEKHHSLSHFDPATGLSEADAIAKLKKIDKWVVDQYAYVVGKLNDIPEGDSTVLDNSVLLLSNELSDGKDHTHRDMPVVMVGGAGGTFKTGQHLTYYGSDALKNKPIANLFISLAQGYGANITKFGLDGTGTLAGLT